VDGLQATAEHHRSSRSLRASIFVPNKDIQHSMNNQLNKVMKTLAIISVVTLLLTVITSFFGMNFADTIPGFTRPLTFVIVMVAMLLLPFVLVLLFRKKDWL
jgi:Mg2+ and Co2+ transporter CorA